MKNKELIRIAIIFTGLIVVGTIYRHLNNKLVLVALPERLNWLNTTQEVSDRVAPQLIEMISDAEKDGMCLVVSSSYRTKEEQEKIKVKYGDVAADPGDSEHQFGDAVDLQACPMNNGKRDDSVERLELKKPFSELPEYRWLTAKAISYGFKQSYEAESWHWRYTK